MKIHVSMETKILLDSVGSYFLEPRGLIVVEGFFKKNNWKSFSRIYVKGCDQRETFWLTGKENGVFEPDEKFDITDVSFLCFKHGHFIGTHHILE